MVGTPSCQVWFVCTDVLGRRSRAYPTLQSCNGVGKSLPTNRAGGMCNKSVLDASEAEILLTGLTVIDMSGSGDYGKQISQRVMA